MNFPDIEQVVSETLANQIKAARTPSAVANIESVLNQWLTATHKGRAGSGKPPG